MQTASFRLYKKQRLCSPTAIEALFARDNAAEPGAGHMLAYPLRAVWRPDPDRRSDAKQAFLIMVPKKRLRHAVDRVLMRRRIREAYRLTHSSFALPEGTRTDIAFVYVADSTLPYARVLAAMTRILGRIAREASAPSEPTDLAPQP